MRFAHNESNNRIRPTFSGQRATCAWCMSTLIGKCGEIYTWHWAHQPDKLCDPWKEHETEWHREWKSKFPDSWQECIIENDKEKHFADVRTADGIVIEFQNSSISPSIIKTRENFYEEMIWVVNAKDFKSNFKIWSVVTSRLKEIEARSKYELESLGNGYSYDVDQLQKQINQIEKETNKKFDSIKSEQAELDRLNEILFNINEFVLSILSKLVKGESYGDYRTLEITNTINSSDKYQLVNIPKKIKAIENEIELSEQNLNMISGLENYPIDDITFKKVDYTLIPSKSFSKARAILKSSSGSLFRDVIVFNTEYDFNSYKFRIDLYDFFVDPADAINTINSQITEKKLAIQIIQASEPVLKKNIENSIINGIKKKIETLEHRVENLNNEWDDLIIAKGKLEEKKEMLHIEMIDFIETSKSEIMNKKKEQSTKVMKEKKGRYGFEWKHERKSWRAAKCTIFFDIGEDYLFEKVADGLFIKTSIKDFLKLYLR